MAPNDPIRIRPKSYNWALVILGFILALVLFGLLLAPVIYEGGR
jgi:hypothetical protein